MLIDEFGKSLESFADLGRSGDPYLLQDLAEWASGSQPRPLIVTVTFQHLAFDDTSARRPPLSAASGSKVLGRFVDMPT